MIAFHGDPATKQKYVDRVRAHAAADRLVRGLGWENGRGCAIGCTLEKYDHSRYPIELGLPEWLARLEDTIFEHLPEARAMRWPAAFLEAIPVGAVIDDRIRHELAARRLERLLPALEANRESYARQCESALRSTLAWLRSGAPESGRSAAESAAWGAAWSAAWSAESAARSAAWGAAWSAARGAESAARSAAWGAESAARSAAESAAWGAAWGAESAAWEWEADTLLSLLADSGKGNDA